MTKMMLHSIVLTEHVHSLSKSLNLKVTEGHIAI